MNTVTSDTKPLSQAEALQLISDETAVYAIERWHVPLFRGDSWGDDHGPPEYDLVIAHLVPVGDPPQAPGMICSWSDDQWVVLGLKKGNPFLPIRDSVFGRFECSDFKVFRGKDIEVKTDVGSAYQREADGHWCWSPST